MKLYSFLDNKIFEIPTIKIRPNKTQPRKIFDEEQLRDLANSISENGILQPLTVRKVSQSEYEIIAGERRLRASVMAGYSKVPCIIVKCNDRESAMLALIENLQRCDLGIFEEARGISRLIRRYGITQEQAAKKLGKIIFEFDGQQIDIKAIEKKAAKLGGDVYVVAAEKKIFDTEGKAVELF